MTYRHFIKPFLILILGTFTYGCASPASVSPTSASVQTATSAPTVPAPSLTAEQIRNAKYQLGTRDDHAVVQLVDGTYLAGTDPASVDYVYAGTTDFISFGDLTGDGVNEAAAIFVENFGGTGNFAVLAIYSNVNGLPIFLTSTLIDDRPMINGLAVENGEIFLDAVVHAFEDPGCCPQLPTTRRYALVNNQLRLNNFTTSTPDGKQRMIEITSPANGTEAVGSVQVIGNVSIAPFENNLSYAVYDEAGNQLALGPVSVTAPDLGAPGTFDSMISLEGIPAGTTVYLEIQDVNAADGSLFALDVVKLIVK